MSNENSHLVENPQMLQELFDLANDISSLQLSLIQYNQHQRDGVMRFRKDSWEKYHFLKLKQIKIDFIAMNKKIIDSIDVYDSDILQRF